MASDWVLIYWRNQAGQLAALEFTQLIHLLATMEPLLTSAKEEKLAAVA